MEIKIYTLSSSTNPEKVRYVGKTKVTLYRRLLGHIALAKRNKSRCYCHNYTSNWINKELELGNTIVIKEIDIDSSRDWEFWDKYWILQFKCWGFDLTNLTDGGDGNQNQYFSEESRIARSKALKGIPRPKEVREKISKGNLGKPKSPEHINHVRESIIKLQGRSVEQYTLDGKFIREWSCIAEAARFYNIDKSSLMRCCQGIFKKSANFVWKYKE